MSATEDASVEDVITGRSLLPCIRRLTVLADRAAEPEEVFRGLASELMVIPGAIEVLVHHLGLPSEDRELVVVYVLDGDARYSYFCAAGARPPAVSWVASSGKSFLASGQRQLLAGMPRLAGAQSPVGSALLVPLLVQGRSAAVIVLVGGQDVSYAQRDVDDAATLVDQAATALALVRARAEAGTDAVTGCMNHRAMRRRLQEEIARAQRSGASLSCLLMDLDDFKLVNDHHGHQTGDAVLRAVATGLMGEFRTFDRVARYGGDEFVVILPETDLASALRAGERASSRLASLGVAAGARGVGVSIGVAQWHAGMTVDDLLAASDAALLRGKREGKQRVIAAR